MWYTVIMTHKKQNSHIIFSIFLLLISGIVAACGDVRETENSCPTKQIGFISAKGRTQKKADAEDEDVKEQAQELQLLREALKSMDFGAKQLELTEEEEKEYLQGYMKILRSEIPLIGWGPDALTYYKDTWVSGIPYWERLKAKSETAFPYGMYYGDLDGDGAPELAVHEGWLFVIKYEPGDEAGKILYEYGDAMEDASAFAGFIGTGIWFHYVHEDRIVDSYTQLFPGDERQWVSLTRGTDSLHPYYKISMRELHDGGIELNKETWEELTKEFYTVSEHSLPPVSMEELFGDLLDETDPLFENWDRNREYDYMDIYQNPDMPYADDATYAAIQAAYDRIDFSGTYEPGEFSVYEEYKAKYWEFFQSGKTLTDRETGEEISITDFMYHNGVSMSSGRGVTYTLFDADGDTLPELAIYKQARAWYIIDYDAETDNFSLWFCKTDTYFFFVIGTRKVRGTGDWNYDFYQLDENGDIELMTEFVFHGIRDNTNVNLVGMPVYADSSKADILTEEMKEFGVCLDYSDGERWFFRVTDKQFEELMKPYWDAYDGEWEAWEAISLPYDEFFAEYLN